MQPWVSVIIPVHNGQEHLSATLASVKAEDPAGVEILLLDSSDDLDATYRIAQSFSGLDLRWNAARESRGWQSKTNRAVKMARAAYIVMLHQDDLWLPGHLAALRASIVSDSDAALSIGPSIFVDRIGRRIGHLRLPFAPGLVPRDDFLSTLIVQNSVAIPAPLIRRDLWLAVGGLDEGLWYTADWDLYLRLGNMGRVHVRSEMTTAFRIHTTSLTIRGARNITAFRDQLDQVVARHLPAILTDGERTSRLARASVLINVQLASALHGNRCGFWELFVALFRVGPLGLPGLVRKSRLIDRVLPRLRLRFFGDLR